MSQWCDSGIVLSLVFAVVSLPFLSVGEGFEAQDVVAESAMALAALVGYTFVRKLRVGWLSVGWTLISVALIIDVLDELSPPERVLAAIEFLQSGMIISGYVLTALGLYWSYRALEDQLARAKSAEVDVRVSRASYQSLFDGAPVGFWETGPDCTILRANRAAHATLGLEDGVLVGKRPQDLIWHEDPVPSPDHDNRESMEYPVRFTHADGTFRNITVHQRPRHDDEGGFLGARAALVDVTERTRLEQEHGRLEAQLRHSQKLETIGTLAGGIAHDFNNLLTPILGYIDMALEDLPSESRLRSDLNVVSKAANRAKGLVKQILAFSRQAEQEGHAVRLQDVVKEISGLLRHSLPTTIDIDVRLEAACPAVFADPTRVHQVIMNLCTNAAHAMRDSGGTLTLDLASFQVDEDFAHFHAGLEPGGHVRLSVTDTGGGMDAETVEKIFDPFFTTKQPGEGTGLGLSVVHGIIGGYGGQVTVYSELGLGTTFHVYLPALEAEAEAKRVPRVENTARNGKERVMVVDDDETVIELTVRTLERLGYRVEAYQRPTAALEALVNGEVTVDAVVTDQTMPTMTGLQLAGAIHSLHPGLPIILVSGFSEAITAEAVAEQGVEQVLMKPFGASELGDALALALHGVGDLEPVEA